MPLSLSSLFGWYYNHWFSILSTINPFQQIRRFANLVAWSSFI